MILVFLGLSILVLIVGCAIVGSKRYKYSSIGEVLNAAGTIMTVICLIVTVCLGIAVSNRKVVDDKIAMYIEENTAIEEQVNILVDEYMDHERSVYGDAKMTSPIVLAQMYPEIKSDTLINSQIDIYVANNEQIKYLKLQKINGPVYRWWLYFGK